MSSELIKQVRNEYFTLGEAAKELSVSKVTIWRWINTGKIDADRIGREVLIEKSIIERKRRNVVA